MKTVSILAVLLTVLLFFRSGRLRPHLFISAVVFLLGVDLILPAKKYVPVVDRKILQLSEELALLWPRSGPLEGRICGMDSETAWNFAGDVLPPNSSLLLNSTDFRGYVSVYVGSYARLLEKLQDRAYYDRRLSLGKNPFMDAAGVKWIFYRSNRIHPGLDLLFSHGGLYCLENKDAYPKVWTVDHVMPLVSLDAMIDEVYERPYLLRHAAFIDQDEIGLIPERAGSGLIHCVEARDHGFIFQGRMSKPGFMVMNDTFYPGWCVTVNGVFQKILCADYLFRGILLPGGDVRVEMFYRPVSFLLGMFVSLTALMLGCFYMVSWRIRR